MAPPDELFGMDPEMKLITDKQYLSILFLENNPVDKNDQNEKKNRKRNIAWYNLPYTANAKTNISKIFHKLLNKHFQRGQKFHKLLNKSTVKLSCSRAKNIASIIASHDRSILKTNDQSYGCNCMVRNNCPLRHKCLTPGIFYEAAAINNENDEEKIYYGLCETAFKK